MDEMAVEVFIKGCDSVVDWLIRLFNICVA